MSGKFSIPSAKKANALLEGLASSSIPVTRVVDDPEAYKLSKDEAASMPMIAGTPPTSVSAELSPAKSAKKKLKSFESKWALTVILPTNGFAYSDPSFC